MHVQFTMFSNRWYILKMSFTKHIIRGPFGGNPFKTIVKSPNCPVTPRTHLERYETGYATKFGTEETSNEIMKRRVTEYITLCSLFYYRFC